MEIELQARVTAKLKILAQPREWIDDVVGEVRHELTSRYQISVTEEKVWRLLDNTDGLEGCDSRTIVEFCVGSLCNTES